MHVSSARSIALATGVVLSLTACTIGSKSSDTSSTSNSPVQASCNNGKAPAFGGKATAFDAPAAVGSDAALATQVSEPSMTTSAGPEAGYRIAQLKIRAQVTTNGVFALHPESFVLADDAGNVCGQPVKNPLKGALTVSQVDETNAVSGTIAFVVPSEANLSNYTVYYLDKPGAVKAVAAWSGRGVAPTAQAETTCATNKSGISLKSIKDQPFGDPYEAGDSAASITMTPTRPVARALKPGPQQPNDVTGVEVKVRVAAKGSIGFVERNQFQLLDNSGNLCRYNELGSSGENLTSALIDPGKSKDFTLIFWMPKGAVVPGWKLLYLPEANAKQAKASWTIEPAKPAK